VRKLPALVALGCVVLVAACGSSHKSASPTTTATTTAGSVAPTTTPATPTSAPAASSASPTTGGPPTSSTATAAPPAAAAGDGTGYLAIVNPLTSALQSAPSNPAPAQLDQLAAEVRSAQAQLSAVKWPGQAETDIRTLVGELGPLAADMARGDAGAVGSASAALTSASVTIRFDLGLPSRSR
jgi:hypothetical protein